MTVTNRKPPAQADTAQRAFIRVDAYLKLLNRISISDRPRAWLIGRMRLVQRRPHAFRAYSMRG